MNFEVITKIKATEETVFCCSKEVMSQKETNKVLIKRKMNVFIFEL